MARNVELQSQALLLLILFLALMPLAIGAQSPEKPEIVLPTALLRVESIPFERVETVLPGSSQIVLPDLDIPLPEVNDTSVEPRLLMPEEAEDLQPTDNSVFSTGSITAGSKNLIEGRIGVFKLGQNPRFRLTFSHQGLDGYAQRQAGTGFFRSRQQIDGWIGTGTGLVDIDGSLAFHEWQEGLQQVSGTYYSTVLRFLSGSGEVAFRPDELIGVYGGLDVGSASRRYTVTDTDDAPRPDSELYVQPSGRIAVELPDFELGVEVSYGYQDLAAGEASDPGVRQDSKLGVSLEAHPLENLDLYGNAGTLWLIGDRFEYPFDLGMRYRYDDWLELEFDAGRRADNHSVAELWERLPALKLPTDSGFYPVLDWHISGSGQADLAERSVRVSGEFDYIIHFDNRLLPGAFSEQTVSDGEDQPRFPVIGFDWNTHSGSELRLGTDIRYQYSSFLRLQAAYAAAIPLFDTAIDESAVQHEINFSVNMGTDDGRYGGETAIAVPVYQGISLPYIHADTFVQITDGVLLRAGGVDLLSVFTNSARRQFDSAEPGESAGFSPFVEPGTRIQLSAEITL